jgi:hypothetical protein
MSIASIGARKLARPSNHGIIGLPLDHEVTAALEAIFRYRNEYGIHFGPSVFQ